MDRNVHGAGAPGQQPEQPAHREQDIMVQLPGNMSVGNKVYFHIGSIHNVL